MVDTGKRKRSASIKEAAQARRPSPTPSPTPSETPLSSEVPTSFDYNRPLPTLPELQGSDLPAELYQSIAESGLMEESLRRSREKWLSEEDPIFAKYWTKPLKKRVFDEKKNPPKETMVKIGECELIIQPHVFEVRLYGTAPVHELHTPSQYPQQLNQIPPVEQAHVQPSVPSQSLPPQSLPPQSLQPINVSVSLPHAANPQTQRPATATYPQLPLPTSQRPAYMIPGGPLPHPSLHRPGAPSPYTHQQSASTQLTTPQPNASQLPPQQALQQTQVMSNVVPSSANASSSSQPPGAQVPPTPIAANQSPQGQSFPIQGAPTGPVSSTSAASLNVPPPVSSQLPTSNQLPSSSQIKPAASVSAPAPTGPPQPPNRPDPVIQLLATKAATDPDLKALMRIVAGGNASQEELKIFQQHIDELTPAANAIKAKQAEEDQQALLRWQQQQQQQQQQLQQHQQLLQQQRQQQQYIQQPQQFQVNQQHKLQQPQTYPNHSQSVPSLSAAGAQPVLQAPYTNQYYTYTQRMDTQYHSVKHRPSHQAPAAPKIVHYSDIVFEFVHSNHGDRFLFPKNSILEYRDNGCTVLASFLILKNVKQTDSSETEFYEPMTVYLKSQNPKVLEHFQRTVADPEVVRSYMKDIMAKRQRAVKSWPVYRLKRVQRSGDSADSGNESDGEARRDNIFPAPTKGMKESLAQRRQSSTPMAETKNTVHMRTGPRVKVIKKQHAQPSSSAIRSTTSIATPSANQSSTPSNMPTHPKLPPKPKLPRSRKGRIADPTKSCYLCKTSKTSLWRKAELDGESVTVCNACGIKWKTQTTRQAANAAAVAAGEPPIFGEDGKGVVRKHRSYVGASNLSAHPPYRTFAPPDVLSTSNLSGVSYSAPPAPSSQTYSHGTFPPTFGQAAAAEYVGLSPNSLLQTLLFRHPQYHKGQLCLFKLRTRFHNRPRLRHGLHLHLQNLHPTAYLSRNYPPEAKLPVQTPQVPVPSTQTANDEQPAPSGAETT
ncbi:hypothetical protein BDZ91DRAFT_844004 [Kalaharituber pfeilii]|nr:hypothetical protein BDZ91DRAFT_844004 [Kalaharituber pfeilii]